MQDHQKIGTYVCANKMIKARLLNYSAENRIMAYILTRVIQRLRITDNSRLWQSTTHSDVTAVIADVTAHPLSDVISLLLLLRFHQERPRHRLCTRAILVDHNARVNWRCLGRANWLPGVASRFYSQQTSKSLHAESAASRVSQPMAIQPHLVTVLMSADVCP